MICPRPLRARGSEHGECRSWSGLDVLGSGAASDRALLTLGLIEETLVAIDDIAPVAEIVLASCESLIAYRRRYRSDLRVDALLDLVVLDSSNPRSWPSSSTNP